MEKAEAFISKNLKTKPKAYGTYEEVYNDPNVDIVYIGTPHALHKINALDAINAGKHVLCEKPFTINANEAQIVIAAAKEKNVFVMEGNLVKFIFENYSY